jgi:hypothetical protein
VVVAARRDERPLGERDHGRGGIRRSGGNFGSVCEDGVGLAVGSGEHERCAELDECGRPPAAAGR